MTGRSIRLVSVSWLPFDADAITLTARLILIRRSALRLPRADRIRLIGHELVHVEQIVRDGWLVDATQYLFIFAKRWLRSRSWDQAYLGHPHEVEAYARADEKIDLAREVLESQCF